MQKSTFVVGLTGGIASGKSTVATLFQNLNIDIIDADQLARELVEPGQAALEAIRQHFGFTILRADGSLDRASLRKIIFDKPSERHYLEGLLHPLIRKKMSDRVKKSISNYCIAVIPLLIETLPNPLIHRILVVDTTEIRQKQFLRKRDKFSVAECEKIIRSQAPRIERLAKADDIIHNTGGVEVLSEQVLKLHEYYLKMSVSDDKYLGQL